MAKNAATRITDDGVLLTFTASDGRTATVNIVQVAEQLGSEVRAVLLAWCEDRRKDSQISGDQRKPLLAQDFQD
jgi:hypothetical protein